VTTRTGGVFCSPSKVKDFVRYFRFYPRYPLKIDLLIDLLIYPRLVLSQVACGVIFSPSDIERSPWKRAFEDLLNLEAIEVASDSPTVDTLVEMTKLSKETMAEEELDLTLLALYSLTHEMPLLVREQDGELLEQAAEGVKRIISGEGKFGGDVVLETQGVTARVATWVLEVKTPRMFVRIPQGVDEYEWPTRLVDPKERVWIAPDEVSGVLRDETALAQLRARVASLAALDPSEAQTRDYLSGERRSLEGRLRVAEFVFEAIDLLLVPVPPPYSTIASLLVKGAKRVTWWSLSHQYRWLLMTEKIDAKLAER
jgi:hypothetical protein